MSTTSEEEKEDQALEEAERGDVVASSIITGESIPDQTQVAAADAVVAAAVEEKSDIENQTTNITETEDDTGSLDASVHLVGVDNIAVEADLATTAEASRRRLWEQLPVATPIFDAEVEVRDFQRPRFQTRFGRGFFRRSNRTEDERPPREPIFTNEDYANPFRCICKSIGIVIAVPVYLVYLVFCTCDWVKPCCRVIDFVLFRPVGLFFDLFGCLIEVVFYCAYWLLMVPCFKLFVYLWRLVRNVFLIIAKCILVVVETIYDYAIQPVLSVITAASTLLYKNALLPCATSTLALLTAVGTAVSAAARATGKVIAVGFKTLGGWIHNVIHFVCVTCLWQSLLLPVYKVTGFACKMIGVALSKLCEWTRNLIHFLFVTCLRESILQPAYKGFISGLQLGYKYIVVPIYKYILAPLGRCLRSCVVGLREGVVCTTKLFHKYVLCPIGRLIKGTFLGIVYVIVTTGTCIHQYILSPIGQGIKATILGIRDATVLVGRTIYEYIFAPVGRLIRATFVGIRDNVLAPAFLGIQVAILSTLEGVRAIGRAFHQNILTPLGRLVLATFQSIGDLAGAVGRRIQALFRG